MSGNDFGFKWLGYMAVIGLIAVALIVIAAPFALWWLWTHVSVTVR